MPGKKILYEYRYRLAPGRGELASYKSKNRFTPDGHLPQLEVDIEFSKGKFKVEGDKNLLLSFLPDASEGIDKDSAGRLVIEADLYPAGALDLTMHRNEALAFVINGLLSDGTDKNSCSGLLILDNERIQEEYAAVRWYLKAFLCECTFGNSEISFKLPVYTGHKNYELN